MESGSVNGIAAYGNSFTPEHRRWKEEVNGVFVDLLRSKGVLGSPVLVMDDDNNPPLGTSRAVLAAAPSRVVCVNNDGAKCKNLRNACQSTESITVVCDDAITHAKTADIANIGGFYFDFCGHVNLSVCALQAVRDRRPGGGYVIGVTYTTARDPEGHLIGSKLMGSAEGHVVLRKLSYLPTQMHTIFLWRPIK